MNLVKLRGKRLEEGDPVEVEVRDSDSIDAYGIRPYTIATSLLSAVMDAKRLRRRDYPPVRRANAQGRAEDSGKSDIC